MKNISETRPVEILLDFTKFSEIVSAIENFWFTIVVLPDEKDIKRWIS